MLDYKAAVESRPRANGAIVTRTQKEFLADKDEEDRRVTRRLNQAEISK